MNQHVKIDTKNCTKKTDSGFNVRMDLYVDKKLSTFVEDDLLPGTHLTAEDFWENLSLLIKTFGPKNRALLSHRKKLQDQIDQWHHSNNYDLDCYKEFLKDIGYIEEQPQHVQISSANVDREISIQAGPQLVVPIKNARFSINAANARWGSLYDALYGTNAISKNTSTHTEYDHKRGEQVISRGRNFLDDTFPLTSVNSQKISHANAQRYFIHEDIVKVEVESGETYELPNTILRGYQGRKEEPTSILLIHNELHVEIQFDPEHRIGRHDLAGIKDIILESALTTIQDFEDSVAAVDAEDKVEVYRHALGLFRGNLSTIVCKNGKDFTRMLNGPRTYLDVNGRPFNLPGTSLQLIRNVGHLMTFPGVLDDACCQIPEGILDAWITAVAGLHDIKKSVDDDTKQSRHNTIYIVKPKMHGSNEVAFTNDLFSKIEQLLKLPENTIKLGIMDEERRTTLNLKSCIHAAKSRVIFINTGFLDRTGDEIHTSMEAGPMVPKEAMRSQKWMQSYEKWNVEVGLSCGLSGLAQIGKGMWAKPDEMAEMLDKKINHPLAGASCAWVPSPTAATLHAMHYHAVDVRRKQSELIQQYIDGINTHFDDLLHIPLLKVSDKLTKKQIQLELDNNAQGILGYVVRWINQGIGCSKVPDINNINLMEDRATLRISSQHMGNWLHHNLCTEEQIKNTFIRMAKVVDKQNKDDPQYTPMSTNLNESLAFTAAQELVLTAIQQPNGYTEPLLHHYRLAEKRRKKTYSSVSLAS